MARLFIFAIGGTGSRVVKALTMLLASGVELKNISEVIPIIIDPHLANRDLQRSESLLKTYKKIRDSISSKFEDGDFFKTNISTLKSIVGDNDLISDTYSFDSIGVGNETFGSYIDYNGLSAKYEEHETYSANQALVDLLFSKQNLETEMSIGFVGNPNIGSVVLNQFKDSEEFKQFAANFAQGDRIFIISSIFGGTGAAGFPTILKNIRGADIGNLDNQEYLKNAKIGALTALPYFGIEPKEERKIDRGTFVSKTKAALQYYTRGVNKLVNKMYYIGDDVTKNYKYDPGEGGQKNDAHFVELASALAIIDFADTPDNELVTYDGKPTQNYFKEFGIRNDNKSLSFSDLNQKTLNMMTKQLSKMTILALYLEYHISSSLHLPWLTGEEPKIDRPFLSGTFFDTNLSDFRKAYRDWLEEMGRNERSFKPFALNNELSQFLIGYVPKKGWFSSKVDFTSLDSFLNKASHKKTFNNGAEKLLKVLNKGSDNFLVESFPDLFKHL